MPTIITHGFVAAALGKSFACGGIPERFWVQLEVLPDIPTVGDSVPGYEASGWTGIVAPKMKMRFGDLGAILLPGSPADFGKLIADETEKWAKVIRAAHIKVE